MDDSPPYPSAAPDAFAQALLPHRDAAYNLARWIMRNDPDAQDCVQDAYPKAFRAFAQFRGTDGRAWLLTIVRNACYSRLRQAKREAAPAAFDDELHSDHAAQEEGEAPWRHALAQELLPRALEQLPAEAREIIVLHEIEGLAYREIAQVLEVPLGTVMSRLSRARQKLHGGLKALLEKDLAHGL